MIQAIIGGKLVLKDSVLEATLLLENGKISGITQSAPEGAETIDAAGKYVAPGFVDCHCHGGGGHDFMDGTDAAFIGAARAHLPYGTTSLMPTTVACSDAELYAAMHTFERVKDAAENMPELLGLHLEGPYFSKEFAGAQPLGHIIVPRSEHYLGILDASKHIRRVSAACELEGALALGDELRRRGIVASIAHSSANYDEVAAAVAHGYTHVTHQYCAMSTLKRVNAYRVLGLAESAYLFDELNIEIIADGKHLPPELLRLILRSKPLDKIMLVTDAMRAAGLEGVKTMTLGKPGSGTVAIIEDGVAKMPDRSCFAGSICTADVCVRTMLGVGLPIWDAVAMMTRNPCASHGITGKGRLEPGYDADIVIFDGNVAVDCVLRAGRLVARHGRVL